MTLFVKRQIGEKEGKMREVILHKEDVDNIFNDEKLNPEHHQSNILMSLYKKVFDDWDRIKKLNGYPKASNELSEYIFKAFIAFDRKYHPDVMAGGIWMNNGFSSARPGELPEDVITIDEDIIVYNTLVVAT